MVRAELARLAGCLLPLAEKVDLEAALEPFWPTIKAEFARCIVARLGLTSRGAAADQALASAFVGFLESSQAPFEQSFFDWFGGMASAARAAQSPSREVYASADFAPVREMLADYAPVRDIDFTAPVFQAASVPNLLIDEVEKLWEPIAEHDDWCGFFHKIETIQALDKAYGLVS